MGFVKYKIIIHRIIRLIHVIYRNFGIFAYFRMNNFQGSYQNSAGGGDVEQMSADFHRLGQTIGSNVQKILQNVSSMQRMIANIGTPQDNQQLQTQLHQIQHYTGQLAKDTSQHLKQLNEYGDQAKPYFNGKSFNFKIKMDIQFYKLM